MSEQLEVKKAHKVDETSFPYIFEENAEVQLKTSSQGIVRVNVYRPKSTKDGAKLPVLVTYGPYGKDIHYKEYVPQRYLLAVPLELTSSASTQSRTPKSTQSITLITQHGRHQILVSGQGTTMSLYAPTSADWDNRQASLTLCLAEPANAFLMLLSGLLSNPGLLARLACSASATMQDRSGA